MKRETLCTVIAVVPLLWLLVACAGFGTTSVATPAEIPTPVTTPTRSNAPTAVVPTNAPTQAPTAVQPSQTGKPTLAATLSASPAANAPRVISFTVVPTTTHRLGEKISATWQAQGTRATLCPTIWGSGGPVEQAPACSDVPLAGTKSITTDEKSLEWSGLQLRVTTGETSDRSVVEIHVGCQGFRDWFFSNAPLVCPQAAAIHSPAAAQHFEHGLMVWVKQPDTFYIFYETNQVWPPRVFEEIRAPYGFRPGASPNNRVGETPPRGLYEPVSGFGQLWRGEFEGVQNVRQRLGWATEPEFSFNSSYQCAMALFPRLWDCYLGIPDGKVLVLRPDSTAGVHLIWDVVR